MADVMSQLTGMQARLYECRMGVTPPRTARQCAALLNVQEQSVQNTWQRIRKKLGFDPLKRAKELGLVHRTGKPGGSEDTAAEQLIAVNPEVLARLLEMKAESMLRGMTAEKIREAKLGDLARATKDVLTMRQLVRDQPTQILRVEQRKRLFELMPTFVREAQRRGYSFRVDPETGEINTLKKIKGQPRVLEAELAAEAEPVPS